MTSRPSPGPAPAFQACSSDSAEKLVELAHVPERERAQKRPQRRGRRQPTAQQPARAPGAQHVGVVDAVGTQHHRVQHRHHLAARVRSARPVATQPHQPAARAPQSPSRPASVATSITPASETRHARRRTRPAKPSSPTGLVILHHEGDLLTAGPGCRESAVKALHRRSWGGADPSRYSRTTPPRPSRATASRVVAPGGRASPRRARAAAVTAPSRQMP